MPAVTRKNDRFEIRLSSADKKLVTEAARLRGLTPTEFALKATLKASRRTVERVKMLRFSKRDQEIILDALMSPPVPTARLKKAFAKHSKSVGQN